MQPAIFENTEVKEGKGDLGEAEGDGIYEFIREEHLCRRV